MKSLTIDKVYETVSALTQIPVEELADSENLLRRLPQIQKELESRIIGQPEAIAAVGTALRTRLLRSAALRPVLNLLCVGPSGVGKTELACQLAQQCFGTREAIARIDGSEYREPHSIARLIGSPPGYVGHGPGQLTEAIRRRPRSVVLLDECEKAAPEVLNAFLQILSAGRLTDSQGTTVDFRRTIVIMTSNIGNAEFVGKRPSHAKYELEIRQAVKSTLAPELLGRMDALVVFNHFGAEELRQIVRLKLSALADDTHGVASINATDEAVSSLAEEAYSPDSGARNIDAVIARRIDPALAQLTCDGMLQKHAARPVRISLDAGDYVIGVEPPTR